MPQIRILDDRLVSQIAAGEVVERPASVVKELVENALDAGASRIEVELEGGGARRIRVTDDGSGMGRDDALLAFDRHATSKIATFEDLEEVATLGFRGEALSSIAAVAKVELLTASTAGDGTRVRIEGGRVAAVEPRARARGTTIEVASLFWNVPARRKFLKRGQTELRHCLEAIEGYALARPGVAFSVRGERRLLLDAPSLAGEEESGLNRIGQVYGPELAARLEAIPPAVADELAPGLSGWVGRPETARRGRRRLVFVNRRLVRDRGLLAAFYRAVREEWRSDEFPALFLFLDLPPGQVDVNVHPQKAEVRFRDAGILDRVAQVLRVALGRARGEEPAPLRSPAQLGNALVEVPPDWEGLGGRSGQAERVDRKVPLDSDGSGDCVGEDGIEVREGIDLSERFGGEPDSGRLRMTGHIAMPALAPLERAAVPLSGRSGEVRRFRLLGQYKGSLILLEGPDGLYVVDQHVAHERILYERLRKDLELERPAGQKLVEPQILELSRAEAMRLGELAPALAGLGFELEQYSSGTVALSAAPAALGVEESKALAIQLASDSEATPENLARRLLDDFAASMACRAAVKIHHPLSAEKLEALVSELFRGANPYSCPHGRPVVLVVPDTDLERRLGRR